MFQFNLAKKIKHHLTIWTPHDNRLNKKQKECSIRWEEFVKYKVKSLEDTRSTKYRGTICGYMTAGNVAKLIELYCNEGKLQWSTKSLR